MKENSQRGQIPMSGVIIAIIGLSVAAIITAFVLPVAVDAIEGPNNATDINQTVGEDYELTGQLNSTLTSVGDESLATQTATYNVTIYDNSSDRVSKSVTADESASSTSVVTLDGNDVVVNVTEVNADGPTGDNSSVATYSYPPDAGWSSGASSIWGVMGLALVLGMMIFVVSVATDGIDF